MRIKLIMALFVLMAGFNQWSIVQGAVAPAPTPKVIWVSGAYATRSMNAGETCWGDSIGPFAGPVVVKATAKTPVMGMINAACASEPSISVWARLEWAKANYKGGRVWWATSTANGLFPNPTPTPVPTSVVAGPPAGLWHSGLRQTKSRSSVAGTACWGTVVRVGTTNHYNTIVRINKSASVLVVNGYCATYSSTLQNWVEKSTGRTYAVVNGN